MRLTRAVISLTLATLRQPLRSIVIMQLTMEPCHANETRDSMLSSIALLFWSSKSYAAIKERPILINISYFSK